MKILCYFKTVTLMSYQILPLKKTLKNFYMVLETNNNINKLIKMNLKNNKILKLQRELKNLLKKTKIC